MIELLPLFGTFAAGMTLSSFYFGGLWWTVRRVPTTRRPALWLLASFFLRSLVVLSGFLLVVGDRWELMVAWV